MLEIGINPWSMELKNPKMSKYKMFDIRYHENEKRFSKTFFTENLRTV
jgi:hypothetical protein